MKTEQSSILTQNSKIKLPNKTLVGVKPTEKKEVTKEKTKLPKPTGWRMLVLPFRMDEKTKGGVLLGNETLDRQQVASQCGNVLAMGYGGALLWRATSGECVAHCPAEHSSVRPGASAECRFDPVAES